MSGPKFTYVPAPHERAYYGALFQAADTERTGQIGGGNAVEFFTRSKVPVSHLKHIWAASDQPPSNALDARKFAVALRLIQLEQNGIKPNGQDLAAVPGNLRPVWFEGIPPPGGGSSPQRGPPSVAGTAPPTPPRPPVTAYSVGGGASVSGSVAASVANSQQLAVQDPYTLTPAEQARYEGIFPEYCKQDPNYMYGGEAVALFGKSGLGQAQLAQIWNMVDVPVDNRLDKLEFAIAMHLIVCVSKKNLALPPGLPISLKQLKSQQPPGGANGGAAPPIPSNVNGPPAVSVSSGMQPPQQQQRGAPPPAMSIAVPPAASGGLDGGIPTPNMVGEIPSPQMQPPPHQQQSTSSFNGGIPSPQVGAPPPQQGTMSNLSGLPGPPPIQQASGGMNVSDAFEGLTSGDTGSISSYRASTPVHSGLQNVGSFEQTQQFETVPESPVKSPVRDAPAPAPAPAVAHTTAQLASSYNMGDANEELEKLRVVLQKLQAENISLKARMGSMTEEEKDIQKELSATVAEVSTLSNELTTLRAQVLASKSRLLEAAAELKASKEKKGVIQDLIAEAGATKKAIDEATEGVETANEAARAAPAPPPQPTQEADLFGGWGDDAPAPAPAPAPAFSNQQQLPSQPISSMASSSQYSADEPPQPAQPPQPQFNSYIQPAKPAPITDMYSGGGYQGHNRNTSTASGFGEVMGGGSILSLAEPSDVSAAASYDAIPNTPSMKEVEVMKSKSKEADDVAKDAAESRRQLLAQMEELRRVADEAEGKSRAMAAKPAKKGVLGRGKKKDAKEIEKLAMDAREKKEALLRAQAQVKDAEALAAATEREAERLRADAEEAEMQAAAAASMKPQPTPAPAPATNGGYPGQVAPPPAYGLGNSNHSAGYAKPDYGMSQPSPSNNGYGGPPATGGFGGPPAGGGFDSSVMSGGGGGGIPAPTGEDPYSNPFG